MSARFPWAMSASLFLSACWAPGTVAPGPDASAAADAGDAGLDAAQADGSSPSPGDGGSSADAGAALDVGPGADAGSDAGAPSDAGQRMDAGAGVDAGEGVDAGQASDAGQGIDAGAEVDAGTGTDAGAPRPKLGDRDEQGRVLTFAEEFDGPQIDRQVWGNETGMVRNQEHQCYTTDAKNQFIEGGALVIRGLAESACGSGTYTSASLTTEGKRSFQYGRLEARIRVPSAKGSWPAFWLLPWDKKKYEGLPPFNSWWPGGGEIDVMEFVTQTPNTVYGTAHFLRNSVHDQSGGTSLLDEPVSADFHVFAIEWTSSRIDWFVDGVKYHSFDTTQNFDGLKPFQDSFYVILNYAIGGQWPESDGQVPDPAQYPDEMRVDWVRYWK